MIIEIIFVLLVLIVCWKLSRKKPEKKFWVFKREQNGVKSYFIEGHSSKIFKTREGAESFAMSLK